MVHACVFTHVCVCVRVCVCVCAHACACARTRVYARVCTCARARLLGLTWMVGRRNVIFPTQVQFTLVTCVLFMRKQLLVGVDTISTISLFLIGLSVVRFVFRRSKKKFTRKPKGWFLTFVNSLIPRGQLNQMMLMFLQNYLVLCHQVRISNSPKSSTLVYTYNLLGMPSTNVGKHPLGSLVMFFLEKIYIITHKHKIWLYYLRLRMHYLCFILFHWILKLSLDPIRLVS